MERSYRSNWTDSIIRHLSSSIFWNLYSPRQANFAHWTCWLVPHFIQPSLLRLATLSTLSCKSNVLAALSLSPTLGVHWTATRLLCPSPSSDVNYDANYQAVTTVTSSLVTWRRQRASFKRILGMHMRNRDCMSFVNNFLNSCNESIKHIRLTWPLCEWIRKVMKLDASAFLTHAHYSFDKSQQHCSILQIDLYLISQKHCGIGHCSGHHSPFQHLVLKRWDIQGQHPCRESLRETGKNWIDPYQPRSPRARSKPWGI